MATFSKASDVRNAIKTLANPEKESVFKRFFKAGLRFPLHGMIADVLENFEIYLHQLTPNAIVRLSVFI